LIRFWLSYKLHEEEYSLVLLSSGSHDIEHWAARELLSARIQNQLWTGGFVIHFDHDQQHSISPFLAFFSGEV
jgi:hypothetical protein